MEFSSCYQSYSAWYTLQYPTILLHTVLQGSLSSRQLQCSCYHCSLSFRKTSTLVAPEKRPQKLCHVECLHVESDLVALVIDRVGRSLGIKPDTRTPRSVSDTLSDSTCTGTILPITEVTVFQNPQTIGRMIHSLRSKIKQNVLMGPPNFL